MLLVDSVYTATQASLTPYSPGSVPKGSMRDKALRLLCPNINNIYLSENDTLYSSTSIHGKCDFLYTQPVFTHLAPRHDSVRESSDCNSCGLSVAQNDIGSTTRRTT
ncbi:hypothetical protein H112_00315 [Trichophyton rubrum D6]|uniref:Uncharacterized protein n=3 Tax=Trichophyton TaxID=5550 RepID=A0A080WMH7_TRIRC|nr:uncharacterized protein TERG_12665 [Trichophyton rubrum CBS 118892]EZF27632.1 hypothetical protein H100_00316 [Trichophyton rubrum MR850]EZF46736.1 hypothetical protein H102_00315 [Trichophyton rubrum CBS 100081]EZF57391.1 hypothetical protein H103_00315 [Trichophyton rubrum CBS 288.86]EZF67964.1 hypothetical protein H104_00314 [Trichophyton rubrum CBS 289.86]EZF78587.1 hypothetical protein H105_00310 [Trichophyton soudanense CBS 452.61]EZF89212.1 hypothetical protein H110_00318 [Trichophy